MDSIIIKLALLALVSCQFALSQANCFSLKEVQYEDQPVKLFPQRTYYDSNEDMVQWYKYVKKYPIEELTKQSVDAYLNELDGRLKKKRQPGLQRAYLIMRELSQFADGPCTRRTLDLLRHFGVYEFKFIRQANSLVGYLLDQVSKSCESKLDDEFNHLLSSEAQLNDEKLIKLQQSLLDETVLNLEDNQVDKKKPISYSSLIELMDNDPPYKLSHRQIFMALIESMRADNDSHDKQLIEGVAREISSDPGEFYTSNLIEPCERHRSLVKDILEIGDFMREFEAKQGDFWAQRPERFQRHKLTLELCKQITWKDRHLVDKEDFIRILDLATKFGLDGIFMK